MSFIERARLGGSTVPAARVGNGVRIGRLVTLLLALCGGFLVWRELEPLMFFRPVDAVVLGSGVGKMRVHIRRGLSTIHSPQVFYRYEVEGQRHMSWQYRRTDFPGSSPEATRLARAHVVGARVRAWYNPVNPADSVLSREPNQVFLVLLGCMGLVVWRVWRLAAPRRTPGALRPGA